MSQQVKLDYDIGDECWINIGEVNDKDETITSKGHVVYRFTLSHHAHLYYVIEVLQPYWTHLEIRDALLMSHEANKILPVWNKPELEEKADE